jgi:hypothetical protein
VRFDPLSFGCNQDYLKVIENGVSHSRTFNVFVGGGVEGGAGRGGRFVARDDRRGAAVAKEAAGDEGACGVVVTQDVGNCDNFSLEHVEDEGENHGHAAHPNDVG